MKTLFTYFKKSLHKKGNIKRLFFWFLLLSAQISFAQYSITGVGLSPSSAATLTTGENVTISFNYTKAAGDVRIFARPFTSGALSSNYAASGSPLYTAASGSGTGTFTLTTPSNVDQIRFQIVNATTNAVLYQTFVNVSYKFVDYAIRNVALSPASPAKLLTGDNVNLTFNYNAKGGNVRIFARPLIGGALASSYAAHGSPLYTATSGSGSGSFTLTVPGDVDQVRIQIVDATTSAVLFQYFTTVNYKFLNYDITNVALSPASPATKVTGENVNITFNYFAKGGNVRIFARPFKGGALLSNYAAHGSSLYTASSGNGTGYFTLTTPGDVDQIRFQIIDASTNTVLYESFVNVSFNFIEFAITNVSLNPTSPDTLTTGENVNLSFNYVAKGGNVRIFARPIKGTALAYGYAAHASPIYTTTTGSGTGFFTLNNAGTVDKVRFQIVNATTNAVVYETFVAVNYRFLNYEISDLVKTPASPSTLTTGENVNLTFNYRAKGGNVRIFARPIKSGVLVSGYAAHPSPIYTASSGSGTGFFTLTVEGSVDKIRFQIIDATTDAVLYEKLYTVSYKFVDYGITNVSLSPVSYSTLTSGEYVNINFKYNAKGGNVRIFARPTLAGALASGYAAHPSPLYTASSGSGSGYFTLTIPGKTDQVRFQIVDATTSTVLYEYLVTGKYTFVDYYITNVVFTPTTPDTINTGTYVNVAFKYHAKGGNVRIFPRPLTGAVLSPGYAASPSPLYTATSGNGTGFFTLTTPGTVTKVRFQIIDEVTSAVLYTRIYTVSYTFVEGTARVAVEPDLSEGFDLSNQNIDLSSITVAPLPANDYINIHHNQTDNFSYQVFTTNGLMIGEGKSEGADVRLNVQSYAPGMYLLMIINEDKITERKIVVQ